MDETGIAVDIRGLVKSSLNEWEGHVCAVLWTAGCNWRCAYCHGTALIEAPASLPRIEPTAVLELIAARGDWLDGVAITGGEPTLQPGLIDLIRAIKATGQKVKLETNGTRPEVIEALLRENLLDCLCMDYKAPLDGRLEALTRVPASVSAVEKVRASYDLAATLAAERGVEREYHTTLCPAYLDLATVEEMARDLEAGGLWVLQQYEIMEVLDKEAAGTRRFTGGELDAIESIARQHHERILMRRGTL